MDILARQHLWKVGLDFKHGTGHGVGSYLNVHEGPQEIHALSKVPIEEGMCVSNEPGFYKDGEFGIRIENVQMCQKHPDASKRDKFYVWENLTVAPYCRELLDLSLINESTLNYINKHPQKCIEKLTPFLRNDKRAMAYLQR
jgi:Xaa-Pro aminopeptidase